MYSTVADIAPWRRINDVNAERWTGQYKNFNFIWRVMSVTGSVNRLFIIHLHFVRIATLLSREHARQHTLCSARTSVRLLPFITKLCTNWLCYAPSICLSLIIITKSNCEHCRDPSEKSSVFPNHRDWANPTKRNELFKFVSLSVVHFHF